MRLFVGIEFPEKIIDELASVQHQVRSEAKYGHFVARANFHLTLQFLGEVAGQEIDPIAAALRKTAQAQTAFSLVLKDIGGFGSGQPVRVIWAGFGGDTRSLIRLQQEISDSLAAIGFAQEKRPYKPHVTLGRNVEFSGGQSLEKYSVTLAPLPLPVERISLIESTVENGRRIYRSLYTFSLASR
jgi:2'-5' RNA ligase